MSIFYVDPDSGRSNATLQKSARLVERGKTLRYEVAPVFGPMDQAGKRLEAGVHARFPRLLNHTLAVVVQHLAFPGLDQEGRKAGKVAKKR